MGQMILKKTQMSLQMTLNLKILQSHKLSQKLLQFQLLEGPVGIESHHFLRGLDNILCVRIKFQIMIG